MRDMASSPPAQLCVEPGCRRPVTAKAAAGTRRCRDCYLRLPLHLKHPLHSQPRRVVVEVLAELRAHLDEEQLAALLHEAGFGGGR